MGERFLWYPRRMETRVRNDYEVIIAGASYAGLAAVRHSACAVPTRALAAVGALAGSVQETHYGEIHTQSGSVRYLSPEPWIIFDHARVCDALRAQAPDVPLLHARVTGFDGRTLTTDRGALTARHFVDATGWKAVLANALQPGFTARGQLTVGMEVTVPYPTDAMQFYVNREIVRWGYGWVFPYGSESRVGLGVFDGQKGLADLLRAFLRRLDLPDDLRTMERAGGLLPWQQRPAVLGNLWLLGDAAGHCLPLTGEGIRFAFQDGDAAGGLLRAALDGETDWAVAGARYAAAVGQHRERVGKFIGLQRAVKHVPNRAFGALAWFMARRSVRERYLARYMAWEHDAVPAPFAMGAD